MKVTYSSYFDDWRVTDPEGTVLQIVEPQIGNVIVCPKCHQAAPLDDALEHLKACYGAD